MVPHAHRFPLCGVKEKSRDVISNLTWFPNSHRCDLSENVSSSRLPKHDVYLPPKRTDFQTSSPPTSSTRRGSWCSPPPSRRVSALFNWTLIILVPQDYKPVAVSASAKSDSSLQELFPCVTVTWFWSDPSSAASGRALLIHAGDGWVTYSAGCDFKGWRSWGVFKRME